MSYPAELAIFRDADRARRDLERLRYRLPSELISATLSLLSACAGPDQAFNLFERFTASGDQQLLALLDLNRILLHYVLALFGQSYWLGEFMIRTSDIIQALAAERHLDRSFGPEDFRRNLELQRSRLAETDISTFLAAFKKREYIRIALRDILGIATLAETTAELSALADVILDCALQEAQTQTCARFAHLHRPAAVAPEQFTVLSLGKLGGNELNYSSDLDLFYLYDGSELSSTASVSEYFTRQAQILTDILCRPTGEGAVFRIDLRLRPQGSQGEMASALQPALAYYTHTAHDWEFQALIKLRCSAGDQMLAREFISAVQPRVYKSNINFAAIDTAMRSRERIGSRRKPHGLTRAEPAALDVKLDPGGIRDIEFLVQCLQRIYGGEEKWLRSGGTLFSLQKLHDKGHISGNDFNELTLTYEFLRRVEHCLQLQHGRQTHSLPPAQDALSVLQRSLLSGTGREKGEDLYRDLLAHMRRVQEIYHRVIFSQERRKTQSGQPPRAPSASSVREMSFEQLVERIVQDSPALYEIAARPHPLQTRRNLHRFLAAAMTTGERYSELLQNPAAVEKAITLFSASDHLTDLLVRHPDALRALDAIDPENDTTVRFAPAELLAPAAGLHPATSLATLRQSFQRCSFAIGALDVLAPRSAFESMRESSSLADAAIRIVLSITGGEHNLAVFALGRLGTHEFDIASDADLLFLRADESDPEQARVAAEKLVQALTAYTREGSIFAVDARLRPHGSQGELVVTPAQLEKYLADEAQPWEALTYTKLRFVAGPEDFHATVFPVVWRRIAETAHKPGFAPALAEMRARLEKSNRYPHSFKLARAGFYDIDFIASFLMLRNASQHGGNTLDRLEHLNQTGFLDNSLFRQLREATLLYRTTDHVIRLVTARARPELPAAEHARQAVEKLVTQILDRSHSSDLQHYLTATAEHVGKSFRKIIAS